MDIRSLAFPNIFSSRPNSDSYEQLLEYIWFSKNFQFKPSAYSNIDFLEVFFSVFIKFYKFKMFFFKLEPQNEPHSDSSHI